MLAVRCNFAFHWATTSTDQSFTFAFFATMHALATALDTSTVAMIVKARVTIAGVAALSDTDAENSAVAPTNQILSNFVGQL